MDECFECGSTEKTGTACAPCNPEITDPLFGYEDIVNKLHEGPVYIRDDFSRLVVDVESTANLMSEAADIISILKGKK